MKMFLAIIVVPAVAAVSVLIGYAIHGSALGQYVPYYVLGGCILGIVASVLVSSEKPATDREPGDFIETVARRDAQSAAFQDLVIVLLVSTVVFSIINPSHGLTVFPPVLVAVAILDALVRQRRLNTAYGT